MDISQKLNLAVALLNISMDESDMKGLELNVSDDMDAMRSGNDVLSERCSCKEKGRCVVLNFFKGLRLNASEVECIIAGSKVIDDTSKDSKSELCDIFTLLKGLELHGGAPTRKHPTTWQEVEARVPYDPRIAARSLLDEVKFSRCTRVSVEGYNIMFCVDRLQDELRTHFLGCGEICDVVIPFNPRTDRISDSCAVIYFWEESAAKKALELSGTDVGGWNVIVKPLPKKVCELSTDQVSAALIDLHFQHSRLDSFFVTVPDTRIPEEDVKSALFKLFSPCGEITALNVRKFTDGLKSTCHVCIWGDGALKKAKALSGSDVGGWIVDVDVPEPEPRKKKQKRKNNIGRPGPPLQIWKRLKQWDGIYKHADPSSRKYLKTKKYLEAAVAAVAAAAAAK